MRIAILGASSEIAKDLIISFCAQDDHKLVLYARRPDDVTQWLDVVGLFGRCVVAHFSDFGSNGHLDAILNFVGVGNPAKTVAMGASIFDVTFKYDDMSLAYVQQHPQCRYVFLSSGAAYGSSFDKPADDNTVASVAINNLQPQDWYAVAKLHAECRHRALLHLPIIDIRVFNYFSHTQDISARFLIMDIFRAIRDKTVLKTSPVYIERDYVHPSDFYQLISSVLSASAENAAIDCYSLAPISKPDLLAAMSEEFGLRYEITETLAGVNATGSKPHYYSQNMRAANFGYQPAFTSLAGVLDEMKNLLQETGSRGVST